MLFCGIVIVLGVSLSTGIIQSPSAKSGMPKGK